MNLSNKELQEIKGGGWLEVTGALAGVFTFLAGIFDGIFRPLGCKD